MVADNFILCCLWLCLQEIGELEQELRKKTFSTERIYAIVHFVRHHYSTVGGAVGGTPMDTHHHGDSEDELLQYEEKDMVGGVTVLYSRYRNCRVYLVCYK